MKVHLNFTGIPILYKVLDKKKEVDFDFAGETVGDLMNKLTQKYGLPLKKALLDANGDIDVEIRVMLNNAYLSGDRMTATLRDGDVVAFRGAS